MPKHLAEKQPQKIIYKKFHLFGKIFLTMLDCSKSQIAMQRRKKTFISIENRKRIFFSIRDGYERTTEFHIQ